MTDTKEQDRNPRISLSRPGGRLELKTTVDSGMVRQSFSHGRSKSVAVEVKRRRNLRPGGAAVRPAEGQTPTARTEGEALQARSGAALTPAPTPERQRAKGRGPMVLKPLTDEEKTARVRALSDAKRAEEEARLRAEENARRLAEDAARRKSEEEAAGRRQAEEEARKRAEEDARRKAEEAAARLLAKEEGERQKREVETTRTAPVEADSARPESETVKSTEAPRSAKPRGKPGKVVEDRSGRGDRRALVRREQTRGRLELDSGGEVIERRGPSLAALKRQRERERRQAQAAESLQIVREVVLPETITVSELANRMAVRGADVVKQLMKMGVMATINQTIDTDTAELLVSEFGHEAKRVSESDVEIGLEGVEDEAGELQPRAPVVTVMGHVDHGKTSLLDALRDADVAAHEAGGITQHIGAHQVDIGTGRPVTFIDTPGHAAFTQIRARGAKVTDIVVLVVAADDGVMPQTVEAIRHAKAAEVPIVVAINKMDRPDADPDRVKQELLSHELVAEDYGGDVLCIEVSAVERTNLDKLIEAIQLQAEILELRANPDRDAQGTVIEAKLDRGRGVVTTVLIQRGTLRVGDIVVCGAQWGRARALLNDRGESIESAGPSVPVGILGLDGVPEAGDLLVVVENERRAREIAEYRHRKRRDLSATGAPRSVEDMFSQLQSGDVRELPVVIKSDVHGSMEAIVAGLEKLSTDEVSVRVLHAGVGAITESDITLAVASNAVILGFNVRANAQAREAAKRDNVEVRYHSIIYELLDEMKAGLSGLLTPESRETTLGHAEIREVFNVSKVGKIAGCRVVDGMVRRGARLRLLRDDVVIHDGDMGSLRRFKDDVREVREGFECGIGLANFNDLREGDVIEAYEVEEVARTL